MSAKLQLDSEELRRLYTDELMTLDEIAILKKTTKRTIANWLIRNGVPRRKHAERYFASRNKFFVDYFTEFKNQSAYIVGYIYADGSVDCKNNNSLGISLSCAIKDREIIDGIAKELRLSDRVKIKTVKPSVLFGKYHYECRQMCSLRFYSNSLVRLLGQYGIKPRKTWLNYPLPEIPKDQYCHFFRGVFDGDGWASYRKKESTEIMSVGLLGPELFLSQSMDFLCSEIGVQRTSVLKRPGHFAIQWTTSRDAEKLLHFMYPDGEYIFLKRKRLLLCQMAASDKGMGPHKGRFKKGHQYHPRKKLTDGVPS